ncbi:MAG: [acyl-carrier-protein] S-malonyltransferase [Omnitrophica WOR_2 bacterium GWF2_43_52]|nr:MAG: [acyl-carrier-protein] S-malonyltransferase [Omnitrophica WOR_2 bacterium GWC2_44_8]OGX21394.1 MAG: [acyl-carrier-protein] S-malonyltransferase [Omnitrophica WOR_2 bacterium GWF2_43_52]OGX54298.1 MAG: [acyl-carrier-protein] S-malonyltransferase [Omnitrophica WOR_2 bacterium RIFOXYC2_FULL_43_9]HAH21978.1 [acyl-carrier-protein] S-malonyltransferase [Candidatus Omnitrophota bacterium]HBG62655.1 [acyl-carrier-protein] S-malonyltransferase [Candidatus Omnitrophota bacterium]
MKPIALLFPGQGSQYVGMGKDLYEAFPESKAVFDTADKVLGFPLTKLCLEGPLEELTRTKNCQPAILTVSIAALEAFKSGIRYPVSSIQYTAGLSLGEYAALVASGVIDFEEALRLVSKRAQLMEEETRISPGKMAAVLGLERKVVEDICAQAGAQIANLNCPGQIVISGKTEAVEKAKASLLASGAKRVIDLEVSGAFHSSLMKEAAAKFKVFLDSFTLKKASIPIISNVSASPTQDAAVIRENLFRQIYSAVLWEDTVRFMAGEGVKLLYEIGPGSVLKGLIRKIDASLEVKNIGNAQEVYKCVRRSKIHC